MVVLRNWEMNDLLSLIILVLVFILLSGLISAVETAVLNVTPAEIEELNSEGAWGAAALKAITERITQPLVVIVIVTNTINVLGPVLAGTRASQLFGNVGIGAITVILTLGTIVFSEIIPKSLGSHYAPQLSRWSAPAIQASIVALYPIVRSLEWFSDHLKRGERPIGTETQIRSLTTIGRREGHIERGEGQLVHRAFLLNDKSAESIMTPLKDVVAMSDAFTIAQAASSVLQHEFSRYPVFGESSDEVVGLVMSRDILKAQTEGKDEQPVSSITREILEVPADMRSNILLVRFRKARIHLAVVRDRQQTIGIVTLEDVLEELVGEIEDEKDAPA